MDGSRDELVIRSFRVCFDLERRIFRVDRWRIPAPYGVPLAGLAYAALALVAVLVLQRLPVTGQLLGVLHPALRFVILPVGVAYVAARLRVDGRPAHAAVVSWLRWCTTPRRVAAFRPAGPAGAQLLADFAVAADERAGRYRRCVVRGPAEVTLRYPARARRRGRRLELRPAGERPLWRGKRIRLGRRQALRVR
jgi:hypothetical protein